MQKITERHRTYVHVLVLGAISMLVRLVYFKLAVDHLGLEGLARFAPDSSLYLTIADHILSPNKTGSFGLLFVGPGYALILAAIKTIFGSSYIWPTLFSVLMGALAPVFVYLLAFELLKDRVVAVLAGVVAALSLTSITLSSHILTDQPYFTFQAAALFCFVRGYRARNVWWFAVAGVIGGSAAYIRPVGQLWPFIFMLWVFVIPLGRKWWSRRQLILRGGVTGLIMLLMVLGWSARNYAIHGLFTFGTNGMAALRSVVVAQMAERSRHENKAWYDYRGEWEAEDGDRSEHYVEAYGKAKARVVYAFKTQPGLMLRVYLHNLDDNLTIGNTIAVREVPLIRPVLGMIDSALNSWLGWTLVILSIVGTIVLALRGLGLAAWVLGTTFAYFSLILGISAFQGSRLHYPAEMAWSILMAYLVVTAFRGLGAYYMRRSRR